MKWLEDFKESCKELLERFNSVSNTLRNLAWWLALGGGIAASWWGINRADKPWQVLSTVVSVAFIYSLIRAFSYRRRMKMVQNSFCYLHRLTHQLRDAFNPGPSTVQNDIVTATTVTLSISGNAAAELETMTLLQQILDNAAHCFREMTGSSITASLIMPGQDGQHGTYLESVLYCSDTDPERIRNKAKQKGGLSLKAFEADTPLLFRDYEAELKKGNFIQFREDWRKWYLSGFMAHFKVNGERWGVLNLDSPRKRVFHKNQSELVAAFADACGLVFNLCSDPENDTTQML